MNWQSYLKTESSPVEPLWSREACRERVLKALKHIESGAASPQAEAHHGRIVWLWPFWKQALKALSDHPDVPRAVETFKVLDEEWQSLIDEQFKHLDFLKYTEIATLELNF